MACVYELTVVGSGRTVVAEGDEDFRRVLEGLLSELRGQAARIEVLVTEGEDGRRDWAGPPARTSEGAGQSAAAGAAVAGACARGRELVQPDGGLAGPSDRVGGDAAAGGLAGDYQTSCPRSR